MRNHNEKARDMARSVLPSTRRRGARADKAAARARERARLRAELHAFDFGIEFFAGKTFNPASRQRNCGSQTAECKCVPFSSGQVRHFGLLNLDLIVDESNRE